MSGLRKRQYDLPVEKRRLGMPDVKRDPNIKESWKFVEAEGSVLEPPKFWIFPTHPGTLRVVGIVASAVAATFFLATIPDKLHGQEHVLTPVKKRLNQAISSVFTVNYEEVRRKLEEREEVRERKRMERLRQRVEAIAREQQQEAEREARSVQSDRSAL